MTQAQPSEIKSHGLVAKVFHWGFALVFIYALTKQLDNVEELSDGALLRFEVIFAALFLALLAVRYVYMRMTLPSVLPDTSPRYLKLAARAGHLAMYISLSLIALSGLLIAAIYSLGGLQGTGMEIAIFIHETSVTLTYASIALHVAAALFHRLKGDGIWSAMVPVWKERNR